MSILAHLVYKIWWFYPFWGVLGPICHFLDTLYMFFKNYYILWIHMTKCSKKGQTLDVVSRVILSQIFFNMLNLQKKCDEQSNSIYSRFFRSNILYNGLNYSLWSIHWRACLKSSSIFFTNKFLQGKCVNSKNKMIKIMKNW